MDRIYKNTLCREVNSEMFVSIIFKLVSVKEAQAGDRKGIPKSMSSKENKRFPVSRDLNSEVSSDGILRFVGLIRDIYVKEPQVLQVHRSTFHYNTCKSGTWMKHCGSCHVIGQRFEFC